MVALAVKKKKTHTFEVKGVKTFKGHEGMQGYNCDLYMDGKKVCEITEDCYGGGLEYRWQTVELNRTGYDILEAHCKTLPKYPGDPEVGLPEMDCCPDMFIAGLVEKILQKKENDRQYKKFLKTLAYKSVSKDPPGTYAVWKVPVTDEYKDKVRAKIPDAIFLDEHPNDWYEICQRGPGAKKK